MGFGSNGTITMVGKNTNVATLLKKITLFLTSTYCVEYNINLITLEASKNEICKDISFEVDYMLNTLAGHLKNHLNAKMFYKLCKMN
jgi:hypothetical protein